MWLQRQRTQYDRFIAYFSLPTHQIRCHSSLTPFSSSFLLSCFLYFPCLVWDFETWRWLGMSFNLFKLRFFNKSNQIKLICLVFKEKWSGLINQSYFNLVPVLGLIEPNPKSTKIYPINYWFWLRVFSLGPISSYICIMMRMTILQFGGHIR